MSYRNLAVIKITLTLVKLREESGMDKPDNIVILERYLQCRYRFMVTNGRQKWSTICAMCNFTQ
jgi:hypothetical protein